jgi:lipopolysaccharide export system permease protein
MVTLSTVMAALLLVFLSQQVVRYLNYVAVGKIPVNILFTLVGFEIPYLAALLLPLALYLGVLMAFGRAYADREMVVMNLAGYGKRHLFQLISLFSLGVAVLVLFLMLWVNPVISTERQQLLEGQGEASHLLQTLMPGRFQASADGRQVIYAEQLSRNHQRAENVFIARAVSQESDTSKANFTIVRARQGNQLWDEATHSLFFVTTQGYRYDGSPGQNDYRLIQFKKYAVRIPDERVQISHLADEAMTSAALWQHYQDPKRAAELQWRLSIGFSALCLGLLAIPLSMMQLKYGRYQMLLPSILIYVIYINLLFVARRWLEQGKVPVGVGMWWVHVLILMLLIGMQLRSIRRWRGRSV